MEEEQSAAFKVMQLQQQDIASELFQKLLNQHLVPVKTLKYFTKLFIIGNNPDLALTQDIFFKNKKDQQQFICIKVNYPKNLVNKATSFNLILFPNQHKTPENLLIDRFPDYTFKSLSITAVNEILKDRKKGDFVKDYLCKQLNCSYYPTNYQLLLQQISNNINNNNNNSNKRKRAQFEIDYYSEKQLKEQIKQKYEVKYQNQLKIEKQKMEEQYKEISSMKEQIQLLITQLEQAQKNQELLKQEMRQHSAEKHQELNNLKQEIRQNSAEKNQEINNLKQEIKQNSAEKSHQIDILKQEIRQKFADKNEKIYAQNSEIEALKKQMNLFDQKQKNIQQSYQKLVKSLLQKSQNIREKAFISNKAEKGVFINDQMKWVTRKMDKMFTKWQTPEIEQ